MHLINNRLVFCIGIIAALVFVYFNALGGPFILDDTTSVLPARIDALSISELLRITFGDTSGPLGRPISVLTFALNNHFGGAGPYSYKVSNLVIHSFNFILVYWFTTLLFRQFRSVHSGLTELDITILSMCCSAVWALHPMQLSTVAYVVQRMAMLSATFSLLALITYLKYRKSITNKARQILWLCSISALIALSSLAKENGVLTILYIGLLEILYVPDTRAWLHRKLVKNSALTVGVFVCAVVASLYIVSSKMTGYSLRDYGLFERTITQPEILMFYIKNIFIPNIDTLSIFHDGYLIKSKIDIAVAGSLFFLLCLCLLMRFTMKRLPLVSFGIGLFLLSHILESTILPLEAIFEHRNYLAMLGLLIAVFVACGYAIKSNHYKTHLLVFMTLTAIACYAPQTYFRSLEWSSTQTLVDAALRNKPDSIRAKVEATSILAAEGRFEELLTHLDLAAKQHTNIAAFDIRTVMIAGALGRDDPKYINAAINKISTTSLKPSDVSVLRDLYLFRANNQIQSPSFEGIAKLFASATQNKNKKLKTAAEAVLFGMYSDLLLDLGRFDEAKTAIVKSTSLAPGEFEAASRLVNILLIENEYEQAKQQISIMKSSAHGKAESTKAKIRELESRVLAETNS